MLKESLKNVIPAKAGIHKPLILMDTGLDPVSSKINELWIPTFAGMTLSELPYEWGLKAFVKATKTIAKFDVLWLVK